MELPWRSLLLNEDFSGFFPSRFVVGANTAHDANQGNIVLTPYAAGQVGKLFLRQSVPIRYFDVDFRAYLGVSNPTNAGGADGIVFAFAPLAEYPSGAGGSINFDGCLGYGVELDTYLNTQLLDPSQEHVAIVHQSTGNHLATRVLQNGFFKNDRWHDIRVRFRDGQTTVWINGNEWLRHSIAGFFPFDGYFGFTSASGASFNEHRLDDVHLSIPTRRSTDLGMHRVCSTVTIDTLLRVENNHPDGADFTITAIALDPSVPGTFLLPTNPVPSVVPHNGRAGIPLRIVLPSEGLYSAVLRLTADNGEEVIDTLRIEARTQQLRWAQAGIAMPLQAVGLARDTTIVLQNPGSVDAEIAGLQAAGSNVLVLSPTAFPILLRPGESVAVRLRVTPTAHGISTDSVRILAPCGATPSLVVTMNAISEELVLRFPAPARMVLPGRVSSVPLYVDSLPHVTPVRSLRATVRYDHMRFRFAPSPTTTFLGGAAPAGSSAQVTEVADGVLEITMLAPSRWRDLGNYITLPLEPIVADNVCTDLSLEAALGNAGLSGELELPVPDADGRLCINASCRLPSGLYLLQPPRAAAYPNPVVGQGRLRIELPAAMTIRCTLIDALGREVLLLFDGSAEAGALEVTLDSSGLAPGVYRCRLQWPGGVEWSTVVVGAS